jgi:hypothetical protein
VNTKPTKKKVIGTIIISLSINVAVPLINWIITTITWPLIKKYIETNQVEGLFQPSLLTALTTYLLSPLNIAIFVVEVILIYLIWSLFQRKRTPQKLKKHNS